MPTPESSLGFRPGADFHLAAWPQVVTYFKLVDESSDRVKVRVLGESTEGRPYLAAIVSSPETIAALEKYQGLQAKLHDPRMISTTSEADQTVAESKPVVVITCSIHSTETASTLMAMELLHELATANDPRTREILASTILILVPSANPDGVDKVAAWYGRSKGHPWEGSGLPELYHKYAGHDTNRDWFMLNLKETQLLTRMLYKEWRPTVLYDVHQMGSRGARLFVPPFFDPINPNLDPRINQSIFMIGAHMAGDLADSGKKGILTNAMYDNWWNGGNRTTPQRHNIVAVLTEAASVKLASPIFLDKDELRGTTRGFSEHKPAVNFVDPWPGGWWRLRDIIDYELVCARSLLTFTARYHDRFQANLLGMSRDAIARGKDVPPFAWIVPANQRDPGTAAEMVRILHDSGIEVHRSKSAFRAAGSEFDEGSWILYASQPYRAHLKDMMERQVYPSRLTAGGKAEAPYDVAGWTLPLQMGVRTIEVPDAFQAGTERLDRVEAPVGKIQRLDSDVEFTEKIPVYRLVKATNHDFALLGAFQSAGVDIRVLENDSSEGALADGQHGRWEVPRDKKSKAVLGEWLPRLSSVVEEGRAIGSGHTLRARRIGVYQPWVPSMDEGWTRLVLEKYHVKYSTLHNAEIRAGDLNERFDSILIPGVSAKTLRDGYGPNETEPAYVGGLGAEGVAALRAFVHDGGTLVCLDASCEFAIEELGLSVKNILKGLSSADFYGPGSILRAKVVELDDSTVRGMPDGFSVYFDQSLAFEVTKPKGAKIVVAYAGDHPLESGWLLGPSKLEGKGAIVRAEMGKGNVILFGFPPQHRGQTYGTFRLLFNALLF